MTLEPLQLLQNKDKTKTIFYEANSRSPNGDGNSGNGILSWIFSGSQNSLESPLPKGAVTPVAQIEFVIFKPKKPIIPKLQPHIDCIRALLDKKGSTDFSDDTIAIYLYKKFFIEANDARKNKKYDEAIKKYKLVLECIQEIKKDENEAEDIQNLIAICYGQLGLQKRNWEKEIENYDHGLQYAKHPDIIDDLERNKIIAVKEKVGRAIKLIEEGNYNGTLDICEQILDSSFILKQPYHDIIKNKTRELSLTALSNKGKKSLNQVDQAPKIDKYHKAIYLFKEALKYAENDNQILEINDYIALAFKGILECQCNQHEYLKAIATYKEGREYTQNPKILDIFKARYNLIFKKWKEYIDEKNSLEQALEYQQNLEIDEDFPSLLNDKIEICRKISSLLFNQGHLKEALESINQAWEIIAAPNNKLPEELINKIRSSKIFLHLASFDDLIGTKKYEEALKEMEEILDISQESETKLVAHTNIIETKFVYIDYLNQKEEYKLALKQIQEILIYNTNQTVRFKVIERFLEKITKILEHSPVDEIINLNINADATDMQVDIMRVIAKYLHKIGRSDKAIAKYNQILESDITDEVKQKVEKEKSNSLMALARQTEESETLDEIIIAYDAVILSSSNDLLKTSLREKCFSIIANFKTNAVNSDHGEEFLELCSKAISEITDEELKSGMCIACSSYANEFGMLERYKGNLDQAIKFFDLALSYTTNNQENITINKAVALKRQIKEHVNKGKVIEAENTFEKLKDLTVAPKSIIAAATYIHNHYYNLGEQLREEGHYKKSIDSFEKGCKFLSYIFSDIKEQLDATYAAHEASESHNPSDKNAIAGSGEDTTYVETKSNELKLPSVDFLGES